MSNIIGIDVSKTSLDCASCVMRSRKEPSD